MRLQGGWPLGRPGGVLKDNRYMDLKAGRSPALASLVDSKGTVRGGKGR